MDVEVIKLGETLGLGGLLAGGMFWFYRLDSTAAREKLEKLTAEYHQLQRDYHSLLERLLSQLEPRK